MMSADVNANIKQQEVKDLVTYLTILCKKYLQNLKYNVNSGCIFHLILVGIPSKKTGGLGRLGCLTDKN